MMLGLGLGGLGLGCMAGAAQISVTLSSVVLSPFSATVTPPTGYAIVAGAASINIPAKPGSYGTAQTVAAAVTGGSTGTVTEAAAGSVVAALVLAGWLDGEVPTISVTVDVVASVLPSGVKALFDISALSSLYQDAARTIPVTAVGQSVGCISDLSGNGYHATQANDGLQAKYQIDGNGHPYLLFDGLDDFYVTPTIPWGSDEVTIGAGVRKLSDATQGVLVEFSASYAANTGVFTVQAPGSAGSTQFVVGAKGTSGAALSGGSTAAPNSAIITMSGKILADSLALRVNGSLIASSSADQGTGNYGTHPLYIGRRGGASLTFSGRLYCLPAYNRILSAAELSQFDTWQNLRTGAY